MTQLWNTYDQVRDSLDRQYSPDIPFDDASGQSAEQLRPQLERLVADGEADGTPRILIRARALELILRHARLRVDPQDWFADHIDSGRLLWHLQSTWRRQAGDAIEPCPWAARNVAWPTLDLSHTSPDWRSILALGLRGLHDRAQNALPLAQSDDERNFLTAVTIVYDAASAYVRRLADTARRAHAVRVIDTLDAIADNPPQTYHQALQLAFLFNQIQEIEGEYVRSQGTFDQLFLPFYRHDLQAGILTREQAAELTCFFFDKFSSQHFGAGNNICFGGRTPDGHDLANELTDLAFDCWRKRAAIDPKLSFRVHRGTSDARLDLLADAIRHGQNAIVFANDDTAYDMFTRHGKRPEDVIDFLPIGCYEPAIMGKELSCTMSATINLARIAELILDDPTPPSSFADVRKRALDLLDTIVADTCRTARDWERAWPQVNPSPFLSGSFTCCIDSRRDVSQAGTTYATSGIMCAAIATLADSLAAIDYAVFQHHLVSWDELRRILRDNWQGHEQLRRRLLAKAPKYGHNDPAADSLLAELAAAIAARINREPNAKGGHFQCCIWSIDHFIDYGRQTGATPDGRLAHSNLSKNIDPTLGADTEGVTAMLLSAARIPHADCPDGTVLDVTLHPSALAGPDGHKVIPSLIRTYFNAGGLFVHFNVLDPAVLRDAQQNPERHRNLQVRVCGWNTRFNDLTRDLQDAFIDAAEAH